MNNTETIKISSFLYDQFMESLDCKILSEEGKVKNIIKFQNKLYAAVNCQCFWNEGKSPKSIITAQQIQSLEHYKGVLKPLPLNKHLIEVSKNNRKRGYYGQLVIHRNQKYALCKHSISLEAIEYKQLTLELL